MVRALAIVLVLSSLLLGCDGSAPDDPGGGSRPTADGGPRGMPPRADGAMPREDPVIPPPIGGSCPDRDLGSMLGADLVVLTTEGAGDEVAPSCAATSAAPDLTFAWRAPSAGTFVFDTSGSSFDTVLELRASCDGESLGCDDDGGDGTTSRVEATLAAGQTVLIAIDGYDDAAGEARLSITERMVRPCPASCPDMDLGSRVGNAVASGMLAALTCSERSDASCGGGGAGGEVTVRWTAPSAGTYRITTEDAGDGTYDTVLAVRDGACDGPELACNDDAMGTLSSTTVTLAAGQSIVIVVDAYGEEEAGRWTLNIAQE